MCGYVEFPCTVKPDENIANATYSNTKHALNVYATHYLNKFIAKPYG